MHGFFFIGFYVSPSNTQNPINHHHMMNSGNDSSVTNQLTARPPFPHAVAVLPTLPPHPAYVVPQYHRSNGLLNFF